MFTNTIAMIFIIIIYATQADPELSRAIFVFSKFNLHLRAFAESRELNRYLSQAYPDVPT
jgi:hypothetical protein